MLKVPVVVVSRQVVSKVLAVSRQLAPVEHPIRVEVLLPEIVLLLVVLRRQVMQQLQVERQEQQIVNKGLEVSRVPTVRKEIVLVEPLQQEEVLVLQEVMEVNKEQAVNIVLKVCKVTAVSKALSKVQADSKQAVNRDPTISKQLVLVEHLLQKRPLQEVVLQEVLTTSKVLKVPVAVVSKQVVSKVITVKRRMTAINKAKVLQISREPAVRKVKVLAASKMATASKEQALSKEVALQERLLSVELLW